MDGCHEPLPAVALCCPGGAACSRCKEVRRRSERHNLSPRILLDKTTEAKWMAAMSLCRLSLCRWWCWWVIIVMQTTTFRTCARLLLYTIVRHACKHQALYV